MTIDPLTIETSIAMSAGGAEAARPPVENSTKALREDPYRDFELYLEKVQDELSEVFQQWEVTGTSVARKPPDPPKRLSTSAKYQNNEANNDFIINKEPIHKNGYSKLQNKNCHRKEKISNQNVELMKEKAEDAAWSEGIVAEVNSIIYQQLRVLEADERNDASSTSSSTFTKILEIREPRDQYTQTTPNSHSPTSSVTWPSEYSLYDTCKDGTEEEEEDVDIKSTSASCSSSSSSYNDEAAHSKDDLSCECLGSADSLDVISTSSACNRNRCWLGINHRIRNPSTADDVMTQPSSAENLLTDSRSEEVDSGIGILSDADKTHNGHRAQSRMTTVDCEEGEYYDEVDDEDSGNKRTIQLMMELGTKSSSDPVLKTRTDEDRISDGQAAKKKSYTLSNQQLPEIEVIEACKWLKAAGFPQYAQMYEDLPFPVDLSKVKEDHPFLDPDALRSLYRRLGVLNRCALLRLDVYQQRQGIPPVSPIRDPQTASCSSSTSSSGSGTGATSKQSYKQSSKVAGKATSNGRRCVDAAADDDSDDDECALSEAWTYQARARRWSRIVDDSGATTSTAADASTIPEPGSAHRSVDTSPHHQKSYQTAIPKIIAPPIAFNLDDGEIAGAVGGLGLEVDSASSLRVRDNLSFSSDLSASATDRGKTAMLTVPRVVGAGDVGSVASGSSAVTSTAGNNLIATAGTGNFQRSNSERIRDGAKALLRHVESFKTKHRKRHHRDGIVIGDPLTIDSIGIEQKLNDLHCVDISPTTLTQPKFLYADDTSSYCSDGSETSINGLCEKTNNASATKDLPVDDETSYQSGSSSRVRRFLDPRDATISEGASSCYMKNDDAGDLSDSDCREHYFRDANSNHTGKKECSTLDRKTYGASSSSSKGHKLIRSGSLVVKTRRDREKEREELNALSQRPRRDSDSNAIGSASRRLCEDFAAKAFGYDNPRMRWHSFQNGPNGKAVKKVKEDKPMVTTRTTSSQANVQVISSNAQKIQKSLQIVALSCGQLQVLRKLALVTLTGYMEKYCPTHRTGWNWELPKFIRKTKTPDYKDKIAFGVPLAITMQRTGYALPKCIQKAILWLQNNALEQVGLFRKSGVKSRIQSLKQLIETHGDEVSFEGQQAYDVADVVKQYFRELPEALLTNKLSETFIAIFQDVPECKQHEAITCALLLLPDEHREALQTLLEFLAIVAEQVHHNQMTIRNIAVCLAPSLFHSVHGHGNVCSLNGTPNKPSSSPRRKKATGIPDAKELNATKASHDCLQFLIREHKMLFRVPQESLDKCNFNYMDQSIPLYREQLGSDTNQNWLTYQYECTTALLKEARKESRGWVSFVHSFDTSVDVAYKKVGDGHPLRLWRVTTEVEAPPQEVLHSILNERKVWDSSLLSSFVVERPEEHCDVFCYTTASMASLPPREFCVLRSWRTDLNKGACCMVETSVKRPMMTYTSPPGTPKSGNDCFGSITGVVLASRYFIEPCGSGRSKVMHLSRVDTKGRTLEFYTKIYGHICAAQLTSLRKAFVIKSEGPESKV